MSPFLKFLIEDMPVPQPTLDSAESLLAIMGEPDSASVDMSTMRGLEMSWFREDKILESYIDEEGYIKFIKVVFDDEGEYHTSVEDGNMMELLEWLESR